MPIKTLIDFGLSEKEAQVYLALLELEMAGVYELAKKSGVNRSSAYVVLDSLKKKGLVSTSPDKKIQQFIASSPDTLLHIAKSRNEKTAQIQKKIEDCLPELRALHKETKHKPKVVVYEGDEAIKINYYSVFNSKEFRIYKDLSDMTQMVPSDYVKKDALKRKDENVKLIMISPNSEENRNIAKKYKQYKPTDEIALIPKENFSRSGKNIGIGIFKDRVKFSSAKEKFAIFIIDQAITDTLRDLFDLAFEESKRLNKTLSNRQLNNKF